MPSVDPTTPRARIHDHHDDDPPPAAPAAQRPSAPSPRADSSINANIAAAARNASTFNDQILYFGANPGSRALELDALGPNVARVITPSSSSAVKLGRTSYDLSTPEGVLGFSDAVGTTPEQRVKLGTLLGRLPTDDRDELGKMAAAWSPAERGGTIPSRLVLSGHSGGYQVYGDEHNGAIAYDNLRELANIMPKAAAQIEDIHFASCNSEGKIQSAETWREAFPNLKTMWGYSGTSRLHPTDDLKAWEIATRGRTGTLSEGLMRWHGNATAWSARGGVTNAGLSLSERRDLVADAQTRFGAYFSGQTPITNPHEPRAEHDYVAFQMLAAAHDATPADKSAANAQAQQMVRLRYWDQSVRGEIAKTYGGQINAAFAQEGMDPVDFRTLSRKDALAVLDQYKQKHGSLGVTMSGIVDLNPAIVPESWCR